MSDDARLEALKLRWQVDQSPRVFVQLAQELRRRGDLAEALEVIDDGLARHPNSLAGRLLKGRCLLEGERPEEARVVLGAVLEQDPTHVVATRLLAESAIGQGELALAEEYLERGRLIGVPEEEIEALRARLEDARSSLTPEEAGPLPPIQAEPPSESVLDAEAAESMPSAVPPETRAEPTATDDPVFPLPAARPPLVLEAAQRAERRLLGGRNENPFGSVHVPSALGEPVDNSLFRFPAPVKARGAVVLAVAEHAVALEHDVQDDPLVAETDLLSTGGSGGEPAMAEVPTDLEIGEGELVGGDDIPTEGREDLPDLGQPDGARGEEIVPERTIEPAPLEASGEIAELDPVPETSPEPEPTESGVEIAAVERVGPDGTGVESGAATDPPADSAPEMAAFEPPDAVVPLPETTAEPSPTAAPEAPAASMTLAELYLRQGHLDDAEAMGRAVLEAEPENDSARRFLDGVEARRRPRLTADELLAGQAPATGITSRKIAMLTGYLRRLREGGRS